MIRGRKLIVGLLSIGATVGVVKWGFNKQDATKARIDENNNTHKKIAVIGAGVSGIVATKWLIEAGHQVKTFEQAGDIGGNWYYISLDNHDSAHEVSSSCYENLTSITTSNSMSFEGFPMPKRYGVFPRHSHVHK
jgi:cation diffusion facilitator CzcD-associated flavoprotein CzcO